MITDALTSALSPIQWGVFLVIIGAILMPRFIPPAARVLGRTCRLMGRPDSARRRPSATVRTIPAKDDPAGETPAAPLPLWLVTLIVASLTAVLSWWLLRSR
jgi:hypothetical protein